jgi:tetraprenyl-beta-curcumene synthase
MSDATATERYGASATGRRQAQSTELPGSPGSRAALMSMSSIYCTSIFPLLSRDLRRWKARARTIPDPVLRRAALEASLKRGNMEGAALLAVLAPRSMRASCVHALVALQSAYNYLDTLAERRSLDTRANGQRLHEALPAALDSSVPLTDYYAANGPRDDGGYLLEMVRTARRELSALPSYEIIQPAAKAAALRIVGFQSLSHGDDRGLGHRELEQWTRGSAPSAIGLRWWELAAAAGSSLGMYALIGVAGRRNVAHQEVLAFEQAYFPSIGALHSLLDSVVDLEEDREDGQLSLLSHYSSSLEAARRIGTIAADARRQARALPQGACHEAVLRAMCSHYLSSPQARSSEARLVRNEIRIQAGLPGGVMLSMFRASRAPSGMLRRRG